MIRYKVGDLLEAARNGDVHVIAHCCNCFISMGSGIAPQIKKAYPYAFTADQGTTRGDPKKLGTFSLGVPSKVELDATQYPLPDVFNLYGQYGYNKRQQGGRDLDYNALYDALQAMAYKLDDNGHYDGCTVGLPLIGAGLANGDWLVIERMIEQTLVKAGFEVVVYVMSAEALGLAILG